jgi:DUF1365 family protein
VNTPFQSAIYTGTLHHQRKSPKFHDFRYQVTFFYIDLAEVKRIFNLPLFFWDRFPRIFGFNRNRYLAGGASLDQTVRDLIFAKTAKKHEGPIRMLSQISYFGFCFNPVSFFYCFDRSGEHLEFIVAEVSNTPWNERKSYVFPCNRDDEQHRFEFKKDFHVSPFFPMNLEYVWIFKSPNPRVGSSLNVLMEDWNDSRTERVFFANLVLNPQPMTRSNLFKNIVSFPFMTFKTFGAIYIQAMRLWIKKVPFYSHPKNIQKVGDTE